MWAIYGLLWKHWDLAVKIIEVVIIIDKMDRYFLCARYYAKSFSYLALVLSLFPITDEKVGLQRPSNLSYVAVSTEMGEPGFEFESWLQSPCTASPLCGVKCLHTVSILPLPWEQFRWTLTPLSLMASVQYLETGELVNIWKWEIPSEYSIHSFGKGLSEAWEPAILTCVQGPRASPQRRCPWGWGGPL